MTSSPKNQQNMRNDHQSDEQNPFSLVDFFAMLIRWRRFLVINFLVVTLLAIVVSFLLPIWYKATGSILPPKEQGLLNTFGISSSLLKGLASPQRLSGLAPNLGMYNFIAILKSRSAMEAVVRKFDLINVYDVSDSSMELAIKELEDNAIFEIQEENYISIDVYDKDPQRAADMVNYFIAVMNDISIQLGTQEARSNREFIEKRLERNKSDLHAAEESLKTYQEKVGMMIVPEQNISSISAVAELYGMKAKKEVEVAILERTVTDDNKVLQQLRLELHELDKKLGTFPQTGLASFRLYRDVVIQQKIVEFLLPMYEQAKIDEQKDVPVILVLDKAVPPEKKYKPKRLLIVATASGLSIFFSFILILFKVYVDTLKRKQYDDYIRWKNLIAEVKDDLPLLRRKREHRNEGS
ncbi:MAG TPA: GNVR domain-containing protein [Bacteroidota bacterium]|nr:GNVR domain-containing protein [Bacteroidota bacterium]